MIGDNRAPTPWRRGPGEPVTVLAHRGGAGPWPENSLEAFTAALRAGADGVELDVRRTLDGVLVVHHDPDVPGVGPVAQLRARDLPAHVPTLVAVLEACAGAALDIEVKNLPTEPGFDPDHGVAVDLGALLADGGAGGGGGAAGPSPVLVSSFWPDTLGALAGADQASREAGGPALALLVHPAFDLDSALEAALGLGCAALNPHHSQVTADLVRRCHDLGMAVVTWTVNLPAELDAVVGAGVDAVVTDQVEATLVRLGRA